MDKQVSLYFLSALSQSMAALLAIGGVFAIYQLQRIDNLFEQTCNGFRNYMKTQSFLNREQKEEIPSWLTKDVPSILLFHFHRIKTKTPSDPLDGFVDYFTRLEALKNSRKQLKDEFWIPAISTAFMFLSSLWTLAITPRYGFDKCFFVTMTALTILPIGTLIRYMYISLHGVSDFVFNVPIVFIDAELNKLRENYLRNKGKQMLKEYDREKAEIEKELRAQN